MSIYNFAVRLRLILSYYSTELDAEKRLALQEEKQMVSRRIHQLLNETSC